MKARGVQLLFVLQGGAFVSIIEDLIAIWLNVISINPSAPRCITFDMIEAGHFKVLNLCMC